MGVKRVVQEKLPEGVNDRGLTLTGFLFLHALFIEKGRLETTWTVLRKFGYNNDIRLDEDQLPPPVKRTADQVFPIGFCCGYKFKMFIKILPPTHITQKHTFVCVA